MFTVTSWLTRKYVLDKGVLSLNFGLFPHRYERLTAGLILKTVFEKLVKCYIWSIALYGAETWTLRAVD